MTYKKAAYRFFCIYTTTGLPTNIKCLTEILTSSLPKLYKKYYYDIFNSNDFEPIMTRWRELVDIIGQQIRADVIGKKPILEKSWMLIMTEY